MCGRGHTAFRSSRFLAWPRSLPQNQLLVPVSDDATSRLSVPWRTHRRRSARCWRRSSPLDPMMGVRVPGDGRRAAYRRSLLPRLPAARPGRRPALEPGAASADDGRPHLRSGRLAEGARRNGQSVERRVRTLTALIRICPYPLTEILHPCGLAGGAVGDFGTGTFTSADFLSLLVDGMPIRLGDGDRRVSRPPLFSWPLFLRLA